MTRIGHGWLTQVIGLAATGRYAPALFVFREGARTGNM